MRKRIAIKDHVQEIQLINRRCITSFIIMVLLILALIGRLGYLQLAKKDLYNTLSQKNWLDLVPLEPTRGLIYDRNGIMLAENIPVFSLDVIPDKISNAPKLLSEIAKIVPLADTDIAQFQKQLKQHRRFDEITLKLSLSEVEVAHFAENQYRFPGVAVKAHLIRNYPYTTTFSHVLGYVGRINLDELNDIDQANYSATNYIGKLGIEKYYEDELHGTVGYQQAETDASGEAIRVIKQTNPLPGKNLYLTIDSKLQIIAEQALAGHRGAVVAIQPATGQILALVSEPSYDPNLFIEGINVTDYKKLHDSQDRPLYNRALRGLYPPGSTIKPLFAIAALSFGVVNPEFTIYDPGWYQINGAGHVFHDWRRHGHGSVNLHRAIVSSCDTFFYNLAYHMGIQHMDDILTQFGYGDFTGIDVDEELPGVIASPEWKKNNRGMAWYPGDTLITGIGQGYMLVTPLQLATAVATIANRGKRITPHLVLSMQDPGHAPVPQKSENPAPIKIPAEVWNYVIRAMAGVITEPGGTGFHFGKKVMYTIAAKTGTAQLHHIKNYNSNVAREDQSALPERIRDNSLFVAFAPVDKPQIALAVMMENDDKAGTVARKVMDYFILGHLPSPDVLPDQGTYHATN